MDEQEKARKFAAVLSRAVVRIGDEYNLGADAICSALANVMLQQARAAGVPDMSLPEWLRELANIAEVRRERTRHTPIAACHAVHDVMRPPPQEDPRANSTLQTMWTICEAGRQ